MGPATQRALDYFEERDMSMGDRARVLLVDDDPSLLRMVSIRLQRDGYDVRAVGSGRKALAELPCFRPHVVITDMRMNGMDGLTLFDAIHSREPTLPVVMLTGHGTIPAAVDATQRGLFAYLTKPFDSECLLDTIDRAVGMFGAPIETPMGDTAWCEDIVTRSAAMQTLLRAAWLVARSDASVLIRGDSGTGKELLAQAIHKASARKQKPLVAVNCTAIPEQLLEAELFGHTKGAFTGATQSRVGLIESAHEGTVLLDEIGDMPLPFQAKLLRVLQEKEVRPVGATASVPVDIRVVSVTHQDLEAGVSARTFREDLYYRLNVVALEIPALSERREDIPLLADHLLKRARTQLKNGVHVQGFSRQAMQALMTASWPGNVRQLRNVVDQCVALATTRLIPVDHVERALRVKERAPLPFAEARANFELDYLTHLLKMTDGNVAQAARIANRNRSEFYSLLRKHELEPELFRQTAN
jgi:two-component system response regulator GlrR